MFVLYENESSCWYQFGEMIVKQVALLLLVPGGMQRRGSSPERLSPGISSGPFVGDQDHGYCHQHVTQWRWWRLKYTKAALSRCLGNQRHNKWATSI